MYAEVVFYYFNKNSMHFQNFILQGLTITNQRNKIGHHIGAIDTH